MDASKVTSCPEPSVFDSASWPGLAAPTGLSEAQTCVAPDLPFLDLYVFVNSLLDSCGTGFKDSQGANLYVYVSDKSR